MGLCFEESLEYFMLRLLPAHIDHNQETSSVSLDIKNDVEYNLSLLDALNSALIVIYISGDTGPSIKAEKGSQAFPLPGGTYSSQFILSLSEHPLCCSNNLLSDLLFSQ